MNDLSVDPYKGKQITVESHEIVSGLVVHYTRHEEHDYAHDSHDVWVELESVEVNGEHAKPDDFPTVFRIWLIEDVNQYEGIQ